MLIIYWWSEDGSSVGKMCEFEFVSGEEAEASSRAKGSNSQHFC